MCILDTARWQCRDAVLPAYAHHPPQNSSATGTVEKPMRTAESSHRFP
jgi:hypothetical protein